MSDLTPHHPQEPRWRRMPEERPRQILDAAIEVFGERGLAGARLEDIARRAGVSKGTIYLYFPSKEELFRTMVRQTIVAALEEAERCVGRGSATDELRGYMRGYWDLARSPEFSTIYRLVIGELHDFPDLASFYSEEVIARAVRLISGIIERGIAAGEIRPVDPRVAARMLASMLSSQGLWCSRRRFFPHMSDKSDDQVLSEIIDFYLSALRPIPGPTGPEHHA
ncbi:MAG TPA: TetR/AcrR family transcriptional regulator [Gemmatimonadaceae bacterium]|nr:TetR/AcrR family transcriptional regulator [Gemmatimonadaceae bacterium]